MIKIKKYPEVEYLKQCFSIDEKTGKMTWNERPLEHFKNERGMRVFNTKYAGIEAGFVSKNQHGKPYRKVTICGKYYYCHRIAYMLIFGELGHLEEIDHIDGNGLNNSKLNMRAVSRVENCRNRRRNSNNSSGVSGVHFDSQSSKWKASISANGRKRTIGNFSLKSDAISARKSAEVSIGFHKNSGSERDL